jgi:AcrR family transcriptional regulator
MSRKMSPSEAGHTRPAASKPALPSRKRNTDRRVLQTRDALGDALVALMHERPFDSITVQQVLDRAGIARSTFYSHYRDKDDLFLSDVEDFWEGAAMALTRRGDASHRVAPVRELFAHVAEARDFYEALVASGRVYDVMQLGEGHFARAIEQRLSQLPRSAASRPSTTRGAASAGLTDEAVRKITAQALAGALFSLLHWWARRSDRPAPQQMDALYHQLVWSGAAPPSVAKRTESSQSNPLTKLTARV